MAWAVDVEWAEKGWVVGMGRDGMAWSVRRGWVGDELAWRVEVGWSGTGGQGLSSRVGLGRQVLASRSGLAWSGWDWVDESGGEGGGRGRVGWSVPPAPLSLGAGGVV